MLNRLSNHVLFALALASITACGPVSVSDKGMGFDAVEDGNSSLKQFEAGKTYKCDINEDRIPEMKQKWDRYFSGSESLKNRGHEVLSRMPKEYMEWMFTTHNIKIKLTGFGGGGLTYSSYRNGLKIPTGMSSGVRSNNSDWDALPHETGHAVEGYFWKKHSGWRKELESLYSNALRSEGRLIKNYAKKNPGEFFAEAFDQFYCSKEARSQMNAKFPMTYAFMKKYMVDPENLSGSNVSNPGTTADKLYLAIGPEVSGSYSNTIYFSAPSQKIKGTFYYCTAGKAACKANNQIWKTATEVGEKNSMKIFKAEGITITKTLELVTAVHTVDGKSIWQTVSFAENR